MEYNIDDFSKNNDDTRTSFLDEDESDDEDNPGWIRFKSMEDAADFLALDRKADF